METIIILQHYWWAVVSLLGAILVFLLFVQGGQTMLYNIATSKDEKNAILCLYGHKWEFTFTTLVTFGGAAFASFPLFYSTSFGGAYWLWVIILLLFVIQAVSYEFRNKAGNLLGKRTYDMFLYLNGMFGTILLGVAVGTLFTGGAYFMDKLNITNISAPIVSYWANDWHGLEAIANPVNLLLGITLFFAAKTLGSLYLLNSLNNSREEYRTLKDKVSLKLRVEAPAFVLLFVIFLIVLFLQTGYQADATGYIKAVKYKYFYNMFGLVYPAIILLLGVVFVLTGLVAQIFIIPAIKWIRERSFYVTGIGVVTAVFAVLITAAFNNTAYFPSTVSPQDSLTLANSSSSLFTLKVMSYVSIAVPFVLWYIIVVWRKMAYSKNSKNGNN